MNDFDRTGVYQPATLGEMAAERPQRIGRYRVERVLGEGGFGVVYLAHDEQLQRLVAVKVAHGKLVARPEDVQAYLNEARTVAALDHPNIVPVYDVGSTDDFPCFAVSKYIEGSTLAKRTKANRPSVEEAAELVATVAQTLHYAHRKGLVHRDIKPGNILLDAAGKPYVADFGLALREENVGHGPKYAGTPAYMSPEQARGEGHRVDGRSDIFSLGVVFYELLSGRQPFRADSQAELMEQITAYEPRPPRQMDERIPKELERICFKALSKRAADRYMTAQDMADDLRQFLAEQTLKQQSSGAARDNASLSATVATSVLSGSAGPSSVTATAPTSANQPIKIVPKGLRSFDAHDADFFLELLPGPRDREGLPDSIRFWKTRIEETDADNTCAVGLIYGPSGCGKSSLVKAGLLPRLSKDVIAVYVEATTAETETRLLNGLRKRCPALPAHLGLKETLAALRRGQGAGKKVLIVLDQFEQWLHARKEEENTELVQALRQCDGGRVQSIIMVRDDFWMAATRFMRDVEIRLVEGHNSAAVDLFPIRHAEKVLAAFGRAFGALPENRSALSKQQQEFLEQAVRGFVQEGKVICVRLALFAEMMKGKSWTPATLKEVGGTEGVGATFLEETFSAATAPPEHRYHQKAARAVLKALLPESGTDIKGHMRSHAELLAASDYASRPKDFEDLLRILDGEIRLITPTDPDDQEGQQDSPSQLQAGTKYYQLTHDYLVHSLRDWLTRKQKETRRGRAELLLADRAAVWSARPENRQLPSLLQWLQIRLLTQKKNRSVPQRKMLRRATRYHAVRGLVVAMLLAMAGWGGYEGYGTLKAHALQDRLLDANTTDVPAIVADMAPYRRWLDPLLQEANQQAAAKQDGRKQLHTSLALLPVETGQAAYLYERLLDASPHEVSVIRDALAPHKEELLDRLWKVVQKPAKGKESQRLRAAAALATYDPDSRQWTKVQDQVANDFVGVPAVFLAEWLKLLHPVREKLLTPLAAICRDGQRRDAERTLATDIMADYAADQPQVLADLLLDADEKRFAVLLPKLKGHGERALTLLQGELARQSPSKERVVLKSEGTITKDDARVQVSDGQSLPAKVFEVRLQVGKTYRMTMNSNELDSFLVLQDKSGKELAFDDDGGGDLNALLYYTAAREDTYKIYTASFQGTGAFVLTIGETVGEDVREKLAKRQANAAVALLRMDRPQQVWPLLKHSPDLRMRSYLIHRLGPLGADAGAIVKRLEDESDLSIRRALILSLGEFGEKELPADERALLMMKVREIYRTADDPGLHAAADWLLRHWKQEAWLKQVNEEWAKDKEKTEQRLQRIKAVMAREKEKAKPQWYINGQAQTMVVISGPVEFVMGSPPTEQGRQVIESQHRKRIGRSFAIAACPVTKEQLLRFLPKFGHNQISRYPDPTCPIGGVLWYEAAAYCNWLSKEEGIAEEQWCYDMDPRGQVVQLKENYLRLTGYRLPTEAEWEYACRAGTATSRSYGESEELLGKYGWHLQNAGDRTWPVGTTKPNDLGLFDMHGNLVCWCQEGYKGYPQVAAGKIVDDIEDILSINSQDSRVTRGGSFNLKASLVRSACRDQHLPAYRLYHIGFRVARTLSPPPGRGK